jgi:hypothetical protein
MRLPGSRITRSFWRRRIVLIPVVLDPLIDVALADLDRRITSLFWRHRQPPRQNTPKPRGTPLE